MGRTFNTTCNATLEDMRIGGSEEYIVGHLTFHTLGLILAAGCAAIAILLSFYLIFMHATNYTKPHEQRQYGPAPLLLFPSDPETLADIPSIIRILFMIPVYATASFLSFFYYWHAVYFQVLCDCYEAFAIASFFALLCHYIAPDLHEQKIYFRSIEPRPWVWPVSWLKRCCGGERGPWRTPRSGLTWFNIIWTGVYHYCFIRVSMTLTAVLTQYFGRYCESSNSPVFAHIWILVIEGVAVTIAMYCLIQFYVQLRGDLAPHRPFLKVVAIKLVIFLSFWQSFMISILTSATFQVISPNSKIAYPDLKVGLPSLLLCIEMALFAVLHLFAFSWTPYRRAPAGSDDAAPPFAHTSGPNHGGFLGCRAFVDAMNPWDLVKASARGMRWLFVGVRHRENDASYKSATDINSPRHENLSLRSANASAPSLPIADEFRRSRFGLPGFGGKKPSDEGAGLIAHAEPRGLGSGSPRSYTPSGYVPAKHRYDVNGQEISFDGTVYHAPTPMAGESQEIGVALTGPPDPQHSQAARPYVPRQPSEAYREGLRQGSRRQLTPSQQWANSSQPIPASSQSEVHGALWGPQPPADQSPPSQRQNHP
ncbi:hypothetical protein B2J93_2710 [Marssonina coronariae]|uniref:DUF300 domain protein n=1 Tax=Diplocarpon coronariae TaxID=2795749 RepID=A0A218Z407_9HELO|nr:hypothetical protein B2J93_2710 [Marssonina coronariae]